MNTKATLKKLHETFPDFDTDTLLKILDCYIEESTTPWIGSPKPWESITYNQNPIKTTNCY